MQQLTEYKLQGTEYHEIPHHGFKNSLTIKLGTKGESTLEVLKLLLRRSITTLVLMNKPRVCSRVQRRIYLVPNAFNTTQML